jgi:hypothetical protein
MSTHRRSLLLITALGMLFFAELIVHPTQTLYSNYSDLLTLHLPDREFLVRSWQETGELPLWCPYNFSGMPFIHDPQVSAFYPFHWPLMLLPPDAQGAALSWLVVFHVIAAGWCMYAYAFHQGLQGPGAVVAALGYMFAGKWLLHLLAAGHYNMVPLAWLPLVLLLLEQAIERGSLVRATAAGAVFALLILGAFPYVTLYAGVFVALWTLGTTVTDTESARTGPPRATLVRRWLGLGMWTALAAVALGAVALLPGLELSAEASRSAGVPISREMILNGLRSLVGLVGPALSDEPNFWENRAGLGILWLALALAAPLAGDRRVRFQAGVCLLLVAFVLGGSMVFQSLPGFRLFRLPSRMFLVAALPVALLTGRTAQMLVEGTAENVQGICRRVLVKTTAVVLLMIGAFTFTLNTQRGDMTVRFHPYWATLLVTIPAALWLLRKRCALGTPHSALALGWIAVLGIDLVALTCPLVAVRPDAPIFEPSACVEYLAEHRGEHGRVLDFNPENNAANHTPLWPGLPIVEQIEAVRGFNPLDVRRYKEYLQFLTDEDQPLEAIDGMFTGPILGTFPIKNQSVADLLGIRYLVQPSDLPLEATVQDPAGRECWNLVLEDPAPVTFNFISVQPGGRDAGVQPLPPYRVYENRHVLPRAFIVPEAVPLPDRAEVLAALKTTDFRQRVFLEDFEGPVVPAAPGGSFRQVHIQEYRPNRVVLDSPDGEAGFLVLTDVWFPGWTCTVDGRPARLYRANFLFRALELPAGPHRVVFVFAPQSYELGKAVSIGALMGLAALVLLAAAFRLLPSAPVPERKRQPHVVSS